MRLKIYCCVFLTTCAGILPAAEVTGQDDVTIPMLVNTQAELGLVKGFTKEAISLQKQSLFVQEVTLAKTADILTQEKLQMAAFDKAFNTIRLEQSSAEQRILSAICFLGAVIFLLILRLCLPARKRPSFISDPQLKPEASNSDAASGNTEIKTPIAATNPSSVPLTKNAGSALNGISPKVMTDGGASTNKGPSIVNLTIEKATLLLDKDLQSLPLITETQGNDVSAILMQAEKIRQESLERISRPQQQSRIPPLNLTVRYRNTLANPKSIKAKNYQE